jgi:hypothetical protein
MRTLGAMMGRSDSRDLRGIAAAVVGINMLGFGLVDGPTRADQVREGEKVYCVTSRALSDQEGAG